MQRSLQRMVRSMWTESGMWSATLFWKSRSMRSGIELRSVRLFVRDADATLGGEFPARQRRGLEHLLAHDLGGLVFPLALLILTRVPLLLTRVCHVASCAPFRGVSDTITRLRSQSFSMKPVASRSACARSTSNASQMRPTTALTGVVPSAASQINVPTAFSVLSELFSGRRITASPS